MTTLKAWNHAIGETCELEVPAARDEGVALYGQVTAAYYAELRRGARILLETQGGISMTTQNGWTISR